MDRRGLTNSDLENFPESIETSMCDSIGCGALSRYANEPSNLSLELQLIHSFRPRLLQGKVQSSESIRVDFCLEARGFSQTAVNEDAVDRESNFQKNAEQRNSSLNSSFLFSFLHLLNRYQSFYWRFCFSLYGCSVLQVTWCSSSNTTMLIYNRQSSVVI